MTFEPPPDLLETASRPAPERASDRALDALSHFCVILAGAALVTLIAIFGWLVFGRYVLNDTPTWVEQAALLLVAYIAFLGAAVGVREHTHLRIEFVRDAFPAPARMALEYVAEALMFAFGAVMLWQGWVLVLGNTTRLIPMIGITESWRFLALAICGGLIVIFSGARLIDLMLGRNRDRSPSTPADGAL